MFLFSPGMDILNQMTKEVYARVMPEHWLKVNVRVISESIIIDDQIVSIHLLNFIKK
jgi:hypothetical protein